MDNTMVPISFTDAYSDSSTAPFYEDYEDHEFLNHDYSCPIYKLVETMGIISLVIHSLICVLGVTGNGLVIFITGIRMKKTGQTIYFLNLAIADFIATFSLLLTIIATLLRTYYLSFGQVMHQFIGTMKLLNLYSSIFFLMVISIHCWICVRYPLWARTCKTPQLASWVALGVWILSLVLSCVYMFSGYINEAPWGYEHYSFGSYGFMYSVMSHVSYSMFTSQAIFSFILPFIVMISCYGATVLRLRRNQFAQSRKPLKVVLAITLAFFVCWFPINLIHFIGGPYGKNCVLQCVIFTAYYLSDWLAYFNSCLHPILYILIGHSYRDRLRGSLLSALKNAFQEQRSPSRTMTDSCSLQRLETQSV